MSMQYIKISELLTDETKFKTDIYKTHESVTPVIDKLFNGWHVSEEMYNYMTAVSKAMPKAKFAPHQVEWVSTPGDSYRRVNKFAVYMDEFPYSLGFVGYGDFSVNGNSRAYMVESRKIKNTKYSSRRYQYHMQITTDLKKATKNASTYLTPYSIKELAQVTYRAFSRNVERVKEEVDGLPHNITRPIRDKTSAIIAEMRNLMAQNVTFVTEEFKTLAEVLVDTLAEQEEERKRHVFGMYVRIKNIGTDTYAEVYKVHDVKNNAFSIKDDGSPPTTVLLSDLDGDLAGNIAVLNMLKDEQYVPRVGYKVDSNTYWLERV